MKKIRGFKLKHRVSKLFRFLLRRNSGYLRLNPPSKPIRSIFDSLKAKAKSLCSANLGRGYVQLGESERMTAVPKGHMAVYVGQNGGDFRRFLVPVIYLNHPLFGDLLREAEKEYGFDNPGGITIPCRISEFERVQTCIAAGSGGRKLLTWKRSLR